MTDNQVLEEKIQEFLEDQVEKKFVKVMELLEGAKVYVPAVPPENMSQEMIERMKAGENIPASPLVKPQPFLLKKKDGESVLPIFTSKEQIPEDRKSPVLLHMPYLACVSLVMNNPDTIKEIVLNPFTMGLTINRPPIEVAYNRMQRNAQRVQQIQSARVLEKQMTENYEHGAENEDGQKTVQMTDKEFRKFVNARAAYAMLPMLFLSNPALALEQLHSQKEAFLLELYGTLFPSKEQCNYTEEDFSVLAMNVSDSLQIIKIDLPEVKPVQDTVLRVYLASNLQKPNELKYYVVTRTGEEEVNLIARIYEDKHVEEMMTLEDYGSEISEIMELAAK